MTTTGLDWLFDFDLAAGDLERQIYRGLRDAILGKRLKPDTRLPATRALAADLGVSRGTVVAAFEQLAAEGYLTARTGRGTVVASLPDQALRSDFGGQSPRRMAEPAWSLRARKFGKAASSSPSFPRCFRSGMPSLDDFPRREWSRCLAARARAIRPNDMAYQNATGLPLLQEALASHLNRTRGVVADADQIVVVPSAQAAFDAIAVCVTDPGDRVAVEDPGYPGAINVFRAAAAEVAPVPVDESGMVVARLARLRRLRLIMVTPSHQYPTGVTMTLARRLALLDAARRADAFVLEDDYDSEYRYAERPIAALQGIDGGSNVVYVGTFSKLLAPGIRAAYLVAPPRLAQAIGATTAALGQVVSHPVQAALADFINDGYLTAHVGRMRPRYVAKRDALVATLRDQLPDGTVVHEPRGGLQLLVRLPDDSDDRAVVAALDAEGLIALPLSDLSIKAKRRGLLLGFALPRLDEIAPAAGRLAEIVRRHGDRPTPSELPLLRRNL